MNMLLYIKIELIDNLQNKKIVGPKVFTGELYKKVK